MSVDGDRWKKAAIIDEIRWTNKGDSSFQEEVKGRQRQWQSRRALLILGELGQ